MSTNPGTVPIEWGLDQIDSLQAQFQSTSDSYSEDFFDFEDENFNGERFKENENENEKEVQQEKEKGKEKEKQKNLIQKIEKRGHIRKLTIPSDPRIQIQLNSETNLIKKKPQKVSFGQKTKISSILMRPTPKVKNGFSPEDFKLTDFPLTTNEHKIAKRRPHPPRAKYISRYHGIVLRADHVCPWVCNAVGFRNYKYFFLVLLYCVIGAFFVSITLSPIAINGSLIKDPGLKIHSTIALIINSLFCISTFSLLFTHINLIFQNMTTIEHYEYNEAPELVNVYDLGKKQNWIQIFGNNKLLWFIPIYTTPGDGYSFPLNTQNNRDLEMNHI
ncbi:s-acyltransferase [Anaeramoeba flamelloides]|uniref:Palmitoyltransferase n=1 Tax=Anaeramoeba flamelloides TaxID=1746091 RepID=A0AAV7YRY5_9EUKA|nr:s-acyltransferase [Anaeramoeba flamelloides]